MTSLLVLSLSSLCPFHILDSTIPTLSKANFNTHLYPRHYHVHFDKYDKYVQWGYICSLWLICVITFVHHFLFLFYLLQVCNKLANGLTWSRIVLLVIQRTYRHSAQQKLVNNIHKLFNLMLKSIYKVQRDELRSVCYQTLPPGGNLMSLHGPVYIHVGVNTLRYFKLLLLRVTDKYYSLKMNIIINEYHYLCINM